VTDQEESSVQISEKIHARDSWYPIEGSVDDRFAPVLEAFTENFRQEDEIGAACSVVVDGKTVVDLWGGYRDGAMTTPWAEHTTVCMMSVAKGVTGIAFNMLVDRGFIDLDQPVAAYWPEFAQNGKEHILVRWLLDHRAAIPVLTNDPMYPGGMFDREAYVKALEVQAPLWEPGTRAAYHVHNQGFLLGEVMRRVTGLTVGPFVHQEIAGPLHAEYWIGGMSAHEQEAVAEIMPNMNARLFAAKDVDMPENQAWTGETLRPLAFRQNPDEPWHTTLNKPLWRECEIASGSGHGNARGVARIYGALVSPVSINSVTLMSADSLERMIAEQHNQIELMQERPYHQALGVLLNTPEAVYMGRNPRSFGHHGIGGSIGFGDPDARIGFSYSCNKLHSVGDNGPRARRLIDALYSVL
jgi:CubicO group peptidase (beta-lactamase class C family)